MYVREIEFRREFDGKMVVAKLRQLGYSDSLELQSIEVDAEGNALSNERQAIELAKAIGPRLPKYVAEFDGPLDAAGAPVPIEEVCATAYFAQLVVDMGQALIKAAVPPRKPPAPSDS